MRLVHPLVQERPANLSLFDPARGALAQSAPAVPGVGPVPAPMPQVWHEATGELLYDFFVRTPRRLINGAYDLYMSLNSGGGTVDDILEGAVRTNPGRLRPGRAAQYKKPGGVEQANADFDGLNPSNVKNKGDGIRVGQLPEGRTVIVRPHSSEGSPTLEVQGGETPIKVRY